MRPVFIAVAGGSASGKTTLTNALVEALAPGARSLALDRYYRDLGHLALARRARVNFDRPERIDWELFLRTLEILGQGRSACVPIYDFQTHTRLEQEETFRPVSVVILDGLWVLRRPEVRRRCSLRIFVECPRQERLRRRVLRDVRERGRTRAEVVRRWREFVEPAYRRYVLPQAGRADVMVRSPWMEESVVRLAERIRAMAGGEVSPRTGGWSPP